MNWQPIETAPKDGGFFLAVQNRTGLFAVLNQPPGCARGCWTLIDGEWRGESDEFRPTHWMPLPAPPEDSQ